MYGKNIKNKKLKSLKLVRYKSAPPSGVFEKLKLVKGNNKGRL